MGQIAEELARIRNQSFGIDLPKNKPSANYKTIAENAEEAKGEKMVIFANSLYSTKEVARLLGVHQATLTKKMNDGSFPKYDRKFKKGKVWVNGWSGKTIIKYIKDLENAKQQNEAAKNTD